MTSSTAQLGVYDDPDGLRELLDLEHEFAVRVCADDSVHGKPHPEPVLKPLAALDSRPEEALSLSASRR